MGTDPMRMSIYAVPDGRLRAAPLKARDTWRCPRCRHGFRRELKVCPAFWRVYATTGTVRPERACAQCRRRLEALGAVNRENLVGVRLPGVDA